MIDSSIEKAPGARANTYMRQVEGLSTSTATLKGQHINAGVMFTSDSVGETLSIVDPATKRQVTVTFEEVEQLIEYTRSKRKGTTLQEDL